MLRHDLVCLGDRAWAELDLGTRDLLARAARDRFVFYWEPAVSVTGDPRLALDAAPDGVMIATPHLPPGLAPELACAAQAALIDELVGSQRLGRPLLWYRTPDAYPFTRHVRARAIVYDRAAQPGSLFDRARADRDAQLARRAEVVLDDGGDDWEAVWARVEQALRARRSGVQAVVAGGVSAQAVQRRRRTSWSLR